MPERLQQSFQVAQQRAFDVVTTLGVVGDRLHLLERPFPIPLIDRLAQRGGPAEVTMRQ